MWSRTAISTLRCGGRRLQQRSPTNPKNRRRTSHVSALNLNLNPTARFTTSASRATLPMNFGSDNWAGAHPAIAASLVEHAGGFAAPYGDGDLDLAVEQRLSEIFERKCSVFFVATGTAANCLALTSVAKPGGMVFAHREAHIIVDEGGGPEYITGQSRLLPVEGKDGKMDPKELRRQVERVAGLGVHGGRPNAICMTQSTESGTVYNLDEIDEIAILAKEHQLPFLMDGARFANALVALDCTPAEMTWKRGVDILSFGATKNGCWCAEAVVFFHPEMAQDFPFIRKRAGQLISKSRWVSAQLDRYLRDDLWLEIARHSNQMAAELAEMFDSSQSARLARTPQANEVFAILRNDTAAELEAKGVVFLDWPASPGMDLSDDEKVCRFVTSFATKAEDISRLRSLLG